MTTQYDPVTDGVIYRECRNFDRIDFLRLAAAALDQAGHDLLAAQVDYVIEKAEHADQQQETNQ